jgi:hypothetical protein
MVNGKDGVNTNCFTPFQAQKFNIILVNGNVAVSEITADLRLD